MNKVVAKRYYRIEFTLDSALSISDRQSDITGKDLARDCRGLPYIPASALAGKYRSMNCLSQKEVERYFGVVEINKDISNQSVQISRSEIVVYDACYLSGEIKTSIRDNIATNEYRAARKRKIHDYEVLEPGCRFVTYVEHNKQADSINAFDRIAASINNGNFSIGAKTTRGLGRIKNVEIYVMEFDLTKDLDEWLDFDVYAENWGERFTDKVTAAENNTVLTIGLAQLSPLSIRTYLTDVTEDPDKPEPDMQQMAYVRKGEEGDEEVFYIPGTSWSGLFRHRIQLITGEDPTSLFGGLSSMSKIVFSESELSNAKPKVIVRSAIDRFSGYAAKRALFTEKTVYGGTTILIISMPSYNGENERVYSALCCVIADIHTGVAALGGETSIGHGLFSVTSVQVNDTPIYYANPEELYSNTLKAVLNRGNDV